MIKSSTKPDAWTLSPQMTAAPELWRGCIFCLPVWLGFGDGSTGGDGPATTYDLVRNRACNGDDATSYVWGVGSIGPFIKATNITQDQPSFRVPSFFPVTGSGNRTVVVVHERTTNYDSSYYFIHWGKDAAQERWSYRYDSNNDLRLEISGGGYTTSLSPPINEISVSACVLNGTTLGDTFIYLNGSTESTTSSTTINTAGTGEPLLIHGYFGTGTGNADDNIYMIAIYDRALTVTELDAIHADPFAMLRPAGF